MSRQKSVAYLGYNGFPNGLAEVQKIILISKSLILTDNKVTVICRKGIHSSKDFPNMTPKGSFENIDFVFASGTPFRHEKFITRNLLKIKGVINEFLLIRKQKKRNQLDFAILSTHNFYAVLYYVVLSKLFGFKTVLNYVEYFSAVKKKPGEFRKQINDDLFDKFAPKLTDSILPISEFLIRHIEKIAPTKQFLKIPGLTDFARYNEAEAIEEPKYFLFCGDAGYKEIIKFIVDAFNKLSNHSMSLFLVINGGDADKAEVKQYISDSAKANKTQMFSKLPQKQLFTYYKNATALLIPLRNTFQDIARFPHKTGEYLASGNPVISTNYGEVKHYFTDMEDMLLAESYEVDLFAEKMQFVINNPFIAREIGIKGREKAMKLFDYRYKAKEINDFLDSRLENVVKLETKKEIVQIPTT